MIVLSTVWSPNFGTFSFTQDREIWTWLKNQINIKDYPRKVTKHSHGMTIYPVEKWVVGGILLGDYKPDQLREHMKNISPENCVAFLSSQSFESKYSFNLEKYTGRYPRTTAGIRKWRRFVDSWWKDQNTEWTILTFLSFQIKSMDLNSLSRTDLLQQTLLWNILSQALSGQFWKWLLIGQSIRLSLKTHLRQLQSDAHGELWFKGQGSFHSSKTIMPKGSIKLSFKQTNAYSQSKMHLYHKGTKLNHLKIKRPDRDSNSGSPHY